MNHQSNLVLIIGSAPDATRSRGWNKRIFSHVVAMNNAWKVRDDWDCLVHPEDFPVENLPSKVLDCQTVITAHEYVPIQNNYGGFVYAGGTMAFTTAYWVLGHLRPKVMAFIGCDMVYPTDGSPTHFYGTGKADPLREDVSLQSLEAKSARLLYKAHEQNCCCFNLSSLDESRLVFPRASIDEVHAIATYGFGESLAINSLRFDNTLVNNAIRREMELGYHFESGRYWDYLNQICPQECHALDQLWLNGLNEVDQTHPNLLSQSQS